MGNIYSYLPQLGEQGDAYEEKSRDWTSVWLPAGALLEKLGHLPLSANALGELNELAATQPRLASTLAHYVAEQTEDEEQQVIAMKTGVKATRLIAAQIASQQQKSHDARTQAEETEEFGDDDIPGHGPEID